MDQPITPHVDLDPQPPIPLVVVYGAFPINSEDEKNGKPEAARAKRGSFKSFYTLLLSCVLR